LALSFLPPKRAAAAFLKKLLAGLEMWKSGAEWQQLTGRLSGMKPCGEITTKTLTKNILNIQNILKPAL